MTTHFQRGKETTVAKKYFCWVDGEKKIETTPERWFRSTSPRKREALAKRVFEWVRVYSRWDTFIAREQKKAIESGYYIEGLDDYVTELVTRYMYELEEV